MNSACNTRGVHDLSIRVPDWICFCFRDKICDYNQCIRNRLHSVFTSLYNLSWPRLSDELTLASCFAIVYYCVQINLRFYFIS